jgi:hypothetical protein
MKIKIGRRALSALPAVTLRPKLDHNAIVWLQLPNGVMILYVPICKVLP